MKSKTYYLHIAGFIVALVIEKQIQRHSNPLDEIILYRYRGFISNESVKKIDFIIILRERLAIEIKREDRKMFIHFATEKGKTYVMYYDVSIYYFELILGQIICQLLQSSGFCIHASVTNINNQANLFIGKSGAGKSTAMKLLHEHYPSLGDDSAIIRKVRNQFLYFQSPWIEKETWIKKRKGMNQLGKFFFIRKSNEFMVKKIYNKDYILTQLISQLKSYQRNKGQVKLVMEFVNNFDNFYFLYFANNRMRMLQFFKTV